MGFIDMAVGTALFLFFLAMVLLLTIQHFIRYPTMDTIEEYRERAIMLFEQFFNTEGTPQDWEETGNAPSELGLLVKVLSNPVLVKETGNKSRTNEPIIVNIIFDEFCTNSVWNNTVRVYNSTLSEVKYEMINPVMCQSNYLNQSYMSFNVNISAYGEKIYYIYSYADDSIGSPNYTITYSSPGWVYATGDSWTESMTNWARYGGLSGSPSTNGTDKMKGFYSVGINGTFDNDTLGLKYTPGSAITGVNESMYIDSWIFLENVAGLSSVDVSISNGTNTIMTSIDASLFNNGEWYHFEKELTSSEWANWNAFNMSSGITSISFYMLNSTQGISRKMMLDEVHFELKPLSVTAFPQETIDMVSSKKVEALRNLPYEDLREIIGEDYRFRIEIID